MPRQVIVQVNSMDAELQFSILPSTTGLQLFEQVVHTLGIREKWYFGLQLEDKNGNPIWLNLKKRVMYQVEKYIGKIVNGANILMNVESDSIVPSSPAVVLKLLVKLFPEDVERDVIQDVTVKLFYMQVKNDILNDRITCPYEVVVLLASYALIVKFGDFDDKKDYKYIMFDEKWIPDKVLGDHPSLSRDQWRDCMLTWYKQHRSMIREDAMLEYLKVAQDLEMYGVAYFEMTNRNNNNLVLGVYSEGLKVYEKEDSKFEPKMGFPYSEIRRLSSHQKKFIIKTIDKETPDFIFFSADKRTNKNILNLCMDYHNLYTRRQKAESVDVNQLRLYAAAEKNAKLAERQALQLERVQRKEIERENEILESKLQKYESQYHLAVQELESLRESTMNLHASHHHDNDGYDEEEEEEDDVDNKENVKNISTIKMLEERKMLKEKIEMLKKDIDEEKNVLNNVLREKATLLSDYKAEKLKNYFNKYSTIIFNNSSVSDVDSNNSNNNSNIQDMLQNLNEELKEAKSKTQQLRNDLAQQQHHKQQQLQLISTTISSRTSGNDDEDDDDENEDHDNDDDINSSSND